MGYGAAGLGYGLSQAFGGVGDALDRVMRRRDERDRYETGLKLDAQRRQDEKDRQAVEDHRYDDAIARMAAAAERAEALRREEGVAAAMERASVAEAGGYVGSRVGLGRMDFSGSYDPATGEFTDPQGTMRGPSQTPFVEHGEYDFAQSPRGQEAQFYLNQGLTATGNNRQTDRDTPPVRWETREMSPGKFMQVNPYTGQMRPMDPTYPRRMGSGEGSRAFYGERPPLTYNPGQFDPDNPEAYTFGGR